MYVPLVLTLKKILHSAHRVLIFLCISEKNEVFPTQHWLIDWLIDWFFYKWEVFTARYELGILKNGLDIVLKWLNFDYTFWVLHIESTSTSASFFNWQHAPLQSNTTCFCFHTLKYINVYRRAILILITDFSNNWMMFIDTTY